MNIKIFYIDLFSGAGGTTTGIHLTGNPDIKVVACVNHDLNAIESHKANHPDCIHFVEDIRDFRVVVALKKLVHKLREENPGCVIIIWASLECTNYSKAKGGLPRDGDSRTLAEHLNMYIEHLQPEYLYIENVREFMSWGPLDKNGKPISRIAGKDYIRWIQSVQDLGYDYDKRILDSADFGAYTSRERYFGQFAKFGMPISWPEQTHAKNPQKLMLFNSLEKWKPVREVLDLDDEGESIFNRKKPLVDATLQRIYAGLIKFVAGGEKEFLYRYNGGDLNEKAKSTLKPIGAIATSNRHAVVKCAFLNKYYSGKPMGKVIGVDRPAGTITCKDGQALVQASFLSHYYGNGFCSSIDQPAPTVRTKDGIAKVKAQFLTSYYSGGGQVNDIENPNPTLTGVPKQRLINCKFMDQQYGQSKPISLEQPSGSLTSNPKQNVVSTWMLDPNYKNTCRSIDKPAPTILASRKHFYLVNPQYQSKGSSIENPCFTLIARMDKRPPSIVQVIEGKVYIQAEENDSDTMRKIKEFMVLYSIIDIRMRMLKIIELKLIQGFPGNYILKGTQTEQKKYIGNAVVTLMAKAIANANAMSLITSDTLSA